MRTSILPFDEVFDVAPDSVPLVKRALLIRGMPLLPGTRCRPGFRFAGWDISEHIDDPIVVYERGDHLELLVFAKYQKDKANEKWVKGWLIVRDDDESPSFYGLYFTNEQAEEARQEAGVGFIVVFGSKKIGSNDEFTFNLSK